jgi:hypothetical protein
MLIILYVTGVIAMAVPNLYRARLHYKEWQSIRSFHTFLRDNREHMYNDWYNRDELHWAGERAKRDMKSSLNYACMSLFWHGALFGHLSMKGAAWLRNKNNNMAPKSQINHAAIREEEGF